ncbi:MAG: DNA polymerase III subunit delta [Bacillota bacterium]|nr:DNA polymerase III subunit delta [Bacillota bacterium]
MSLDILKEDLKNKKLKNLYLFYGPEEYLKKYYTETMEKLLVKEDFKALNYITLEGKIEERKVIEACETMPVFSEKKLVIVKDSSFFKSKKKSDDTDSQDSTQNNELVNYMKELPEHVCLVFYESEINKRLKLVDIIKKNGLIVEFPFQKPAELVKWVMKAFKSYGKEIGNSAASKLVDSCEQAMNDILNEIEKINLYAGDRPKVTEEDVEKICIKSVKSRIFDLTDAIAGKKGILAMKLLDDMLVLKEPVPKIFYMITRQFRQVLEMKLMLSGGVSSGEAASKLGVTPYAAGKLVKQAGNFTIEKLKDALKESLKMDIAIKNGRMDDRMAVELLIAKFSA